MTEREARRVGLEGELTILTAAAQKDRLLAALAGSGGLRVDLAAVDEIDTAGLQILLAAQRAAAKDNLSFELTGPLPEIARVLAMAGLAAEED
ncbi:lipid asymmetry maintenance protein MlaB [Actinoplanes sp. NPDC049265]|uniref:STAS domain-containing protein n=1 Tax=Actinoplanes sp. NPDC049265 TaxID=3363902 RepID=UPI003719C314